MGKEYITSQDWSPTSPSSSRSIFMGQLIITFYRISAGEKNSVDLRSRCHQPPSHQPLKEHLSCRPCRNFMISFSSSPSRTRRETLPLWMKYSLIAPQTSQCLTSRHKSLMVERISHGFPLGTPPHWWLPVSEIPRAFSAKALCPFKALTDNRLHCCPIQTVFFFSKYQ